MISWAFSQKNNRGPQWYIVGIIIVGTLLVYGIIHQLYLMSVVVMLFTGVLLLVENNSEPVVQVTLNESYVEINTSKYALRDFESFAVIEMEWMPLYVRFFPKKRLTPMLEIPLTEVVDIAELRTFLLGVLPENEDSHFSHTDALIRMTKI